MTDVKRVFGIAEFENVTTYAQSGNVIFSSAGVRKIAKLPRAWKKVTRNRLGFHNVLTGRSVNSRLFIEIIKLIG